MIIDKTHIRWGVVSASILAASTVAYVAYARTAPFGATGGSLPGLIFGIVAALLMLYAFLLALRRRLPAARLGSGQFWLRGHLWMGALTVPMVLFHSGFGFGGLLEQVLMASFAVVVGSGLYGLVVQHFIPRLMQQVVPHETFLEQIPFLRRCNLIVCDQAVAKQCGSLDISGDPLASTLTTLVNESARLGREEKEKWLDSIDPQWHGMFRSLARRAKEAAWFVIKDDGKTAAMRQESDFPMAIRFMYSLSGVVPPAVPAAETKGPPSSDTGKPAAPSPLQLARKLPTAVKPDAAASAGQIVTTAPTVASPPIEEPPSVAHSALESAKPSPAGRLSPLQMARMQASGKQGGETAATQLPTGAPSDAPRGEPVAANPAVPAAESTQPLAKLSPLQLARMQAATKRDAAPATPPASTEAPGDAAAALNLDASWSPGDAGSTDASSDSIIDSEDAAVVGKLSPEELASMRESLQQAAPHAPTATNPPATGGTPAAAKPASHAKMSPLELARLQAAAKAKLAPAGAAPVAAPESPPAAPVEPPAAPPAAALPADSAGTAPSQPPAGAKLSPLQLARMQGAVPAAPPAAPTAAESPGDAGGATPAPAKPTAKLSPLELARKQAAAKAAATASATPQSPTTAPAEAPSSAPPVEGMKVPAPATVAPVRPPGPPAAAKPGPPVKKPATAAAEPPETVPQHSLDRLRQFYLREGAREYLRGNSSSSTTFTVPESSQRVFARLRGELPVALHAALDTIEHYCDEQRQLIRLKRLHRQLHWWLAVHIPASVAVMVLMLVHIVLALRVIPFSF